MASLTLASCQVESTARESGAVAAGHAAVSATAAGPRTGFWVRSTARDKHLAQGISREDAVRVRLRELAPELGLSERARRDLELSHSHRLPTGGRVVQVAQRAHGLPVFQARASLIMDADLRVVALASQLKSVSSESEPPAFVMAPEAALAAFYSAHSSSQLGATAVTTRAGAPRSEAQGRTAHVARSAAAGEALPAEGNDPVGRQLSAATKNVARTAAAGEALPAEGNEPVGRQLSAATKNVARSAAAGEALPAEAKEPVGRQLSAATDEVAPEPAASPLSAAAGDAPSAAGHARVPPPLTAAGNVAGSGSQRGAAEDAGRAERPVHYVLQTSDHAPRALEATAERVYFALDGQLIAAYHVELLLRDARGANHAYAAVLDASDASPLWAADLTAFEAFNYRVWAEADGTHVPTDGPLLDATPYPGGAPDRKRQDPRAPILVSTQGFNHNPQGMPDPWLSAAATETLGNNVTAYTDRDESVTSRGTPRRDGFTSGDVRADVTAERTFDYTYDLARAPDADASQLKAAVTQIFYVNNWLHDFWYDSGFDEAAGNAQQDNLGRGGDGGDPLRAEAQDSANSGATNNANMSVLSDGSSPRMQMYVWNGLPVRTLVTEPALSFEDELGASSYGPQTFEESGELVLTDDGSTAVSADSSSPQGSVTDACQSLPSLAGRIGVVERGGCTFVDKIANLERAGAKAVVIIDNAPGHTAVNPSVEDPPDVRLPLLALSYEDGQKLKALLQAPNEAPPRAARFYRGLETMRDGTIDNTVVAHEWGHYLHHRLVDCSSASCGGMSEGWGDFIALMMVVRDGDTFDNQVFPLSQYATGGLNQNSAYFGTRRAPYSTDLSKNPFTFKHIREEAELPAGAALAPTSPEMNEVHNVGEIWAGMLFEVYVNVIKAGQAAGRPFAEGQRRMADYVVAGLKAAPVNPTFTEQRDALIAGVQAMARDDASRQADVEAFKQGFAKRGLGAGAVSPPSRSTTLSEAQESFDLQP